MGIKVCQEAVFVSTLLGWQDVTDAPQDCASGITEGVARAELSRITRGGTHCTDPVCDGKSGCSQEPIPCFPVGDVQVEIEKPSWLQRVGIKISDWIRSL